MMSSPAQTASVSTLRTGVIRLWTAGMKLMRRIAHFWFSRMDTTKPFLHLIWYENHRRMSSLNISLFKDENKQIIPAEVKVSSSLQTVIDISERDHIIELKFEVNIEWYDSRAKYYNIKRNTALNILSQDEMRKLWLPYIIFKV